MLGPGDLIADRYRIERQLGEGGMGAVYQATQVALKREVALKVILPHKTSDKSRDRFLREARVASSLKHPNVVAIYDYGDHEGTLFLAMELLSGPSLRALVDRDLPLLGVERATSIAAQVADVLTAASAIPLVHRDLKPENVVLDRTVDGRERAVVVDFGLAFVRDAEDETGRLTREGAVTGTPDYMPPEQCRGSRDLDGAADVYALGAMLYEMLTAHPPFEGSAAIVISRQLFVKPKRMRDAYPDVEVPGALDDLVMSMLAKDPADRPSASQVREVLEGVQPDAPERMSGRATSGRAARMVSVHAPPMAPARGEASKRVAWVGALDSGVETTLAANGIEAIEAADGIPSDVDAVFVPGASLETIEALVITGLPLVADAPAGDVDRLTALLRLGVAEVCPVEAGAAELARKLTRVIRRSGRRR